MTQRMFLGGPADHRWIDTDGYSGYRVAVYQPAAFLEVGVDPLMLNDNVITYSRHRYRHPAWRIVLTFYVISGYVIPFGESMPGWVEGVDLDSWALCKDCRMREAMNRSGVCFECFLELSRHEHVWIDGVGNELDRCAMCGVPE